MTLFYIYCVWVKTEDGVLRYFGHTENMRVRKNHHVEKHKAWVAAGRPEKVGDVQGTRSVLILEHEDWRMDVVDKVEHEDKKEALIKASAKEGEWILKHDCVNMRVAGRTNRESQKHYEKTHKAEIEARRAENVTCDVCNAVIRKDSIARHRKTTKHLNALAAQ